MTSEISTFGLIGDSDTELRDLALELADLGLLIPVEALGDRVAALSRRLAWDQEVIRYCLLHAAGVIARSGRRTRLHLDSAWPWAHDLLDAFRRVDRLLLQT